MSSGRLGADQSVEALYGGGREFDACHLSRADGDVTELDRLYGTILERVDAHHRG